MLPAKISIAHPDKDDFMLDVGYDRRSADGKRIRAFDARLDRASDASMSFADGHEGQAVFAQIYNELGDDQQQHYVIAKVYDPATQKIHKTKSLPVSKSGQAWADLRLGGLIVLGAIAFIGLCTFLASLGSSEPRRRKSRSA